MKQTASLKLALAGAALAALPATAAVPEITDVTMSQSEASRWVKITYALSEAAVVTLDVSAGAKSETQKYYPSADFLPGGLLDNPDYRTTSLVLRKVLAKDVTWTMGSTTLEGWRNTAREATHKVTLTNNYYFGVFPVTQTQWSLVQTDRPAPSYFNNVTDRAMRPVENVCYNEIRNAANSTSANTAYDWPNDPNPSSFLGLLRTKTGLDFDLPSEAQWEFAVRAGNGDTKWGDGSGILNQENDANLNRLGRNQRNGGQVQNGTAYVNPSQDCGAENGTALVGSYEPNDWGIYDTAGNVWELCLDWIEDDIKTFDGRVNIDPSNPGSTLSGNAGTNRTRRGGSWSDFLWLSNYAVLCAAPGWASSEAMVRLGAKHPANDIATPGSVYSLTGGVIDGGGVADGVSIDGGRETRVRLVSFKGTRVGLRIKRGVNYGSSDADVADVNIVGNGATNSVGVWITGYDNTLTGLWIARVNTGVVIEGGGNVLRNVHPLYTGDYSAYDASCGFDDRGVNNFYDFCYSDHFSTGFRTAPHTASLFDKCFVFWYAPDKGRRHTAFQAVGAFKSLVRGLTVGFNGKDAVNTVLEVGADGGNGVIENLRMPASLVNEQGRAYERHLRGSVLGL